MDPTTEPKPTLASKEEKTLPNTGQSDLTALLISLGGLVSLGTAVSIKRKEVQ
ncbi:TPA: LPXTG cell wall anchor domain-containing protein [Streptococcus suis]